MNEHLDGSQRLVVVDNASEDDPAAAASAWKGPVEFVALERNAGFGAASNVGVGRVGRATCVLLNPDTELLDAGLDRLAAAAAELGGLVGPRVLNGDRSLQASASGPEVGVWPWIRAVAPGPLQPRLDAGPDGALPARAPLRGRLAQRRLHRRPDRRAAHGSARSTRSSSCTARTSTSASAPARSASGPGSTRRRAGSCITARGPRRRSTARATAGARPGPLNWRAAVRRAYGPRREWLGWRALRFNLRLRLVAKTLLGRAEERDRVASRRRSRPTPSPSWHQSVIPPMFSTDPPGSRRRGREGPAEHRDEPLRQRGG